MHKVVLGIGKGKVGDHINGDTLDNRRENLRISNYKKNAANKAKKVNTTSIYYGVFKRNDKKYDAWIMRFARGNNDVQLTFRNEIYAAMARDLWSESYARKNFPGALGKFND